MTVRKFCTNCASSSMSMLTVPVSRNERINNERLSK